MRILVIEDDPQMACLLQEALQKEMHRVVLASTGSEGLDVARSHQFEAILLDAMLPGIDGFSVAKSLRESKVVTPIVMLTARDTTNDIVKGLDSGVDDYVTKPFAFAELLARIRAVTRRPTPSLSLLLQIADLSLDPVTHVARRGDRNILLTRTEFLILEFMMRYPRCVLRRDAIINAIWGYEDTVENNTLDVFIKQLRSKIVIEMPPSSSTQFEASASSYPTKPRMKLAIRTTAYSLVFSRSCPDHCPARHAYFLWPPSCTPASVRVGVLV